MKLILAVTVFLTFMLMPEVLHIFYDAIKL